MNMFMNMKMMFVNLFCLLLQGGFFIQLLNVVITHFVLSWVFLGTLFSTVLHISSLVL